MRKISADWVIPGQGPPIFRGVIILSPDGTVTDVLDPDKVEINIADIEHFNGILCPGFVNTHCHLELSYLQGRIDRHTGLDHFIRNIGKLYHVEEPSALPSQLFYLEQAEQEMMAGGIVAVGDIVSFPPSKEHLNLKENSAIYYHSFVEIFGSAANQAHNKLIAGIEDLKKFRELKKNNAASLAPHSTYSLSPELFSLMKNFIDLDGKPTTLHHMENEDEVFFYRDGGGPIHERIRSFNITLTSEPLRGERPLLALQNHLPSEVPVLLVHNTNAILEDILTADQIFQSAWWCLCPNANLFIENRLPNLNIFRNHYHRITLGTDSLLSNESLSILEEMKTLQRTNPDIDLETLMQWACANGAEFLGISSWAGSISKGKRPGINLIEMADVENLRLTKESRVRVITSCLPS